MALDSTLEFLLPESAPLETLSPFSYSPLCPLDPRDPRGDQKSVESGLSYLTSGLGSSLVSDGGISLLSRPFPFSPSGSEFSDLVSESSFRQDTNPVSLPPISRAASLCSDSMDPGHSSAVPELPKIRRHSIIPTSRRYKPPPPYPSLSPGHGLLLSSLSSHMETLASENEMFGLSWPAAKLHGLRID